MWIVFLVLFCLSFIPSMREKIKHDLRILYIVIGALLLIIMFIMDFFTSPKLITLYKDSGLILNYQLLIIYLVVSTSLAVLLLLLGIKSKKLFENTRSFYLMFAVILIFLYLIAQFGIIAQIVPIYQITTSIKSTTNF